MTIQKECATATKEVQYTILIKWINNILLVLMLIFAAWYYLPSNQQLRQGDICSYTAKQLNETCVCITPAATRTFLPNGSTITIKTLLIGKEDFNVPI